MTCLIRQPLITCLIWQVPQFAAKLHKQTKLHTTWASATVGTSGARLAALENFLYAMTEWNYLGPLPVRVARGQ